MKTLLLLGAAWLGYEWYVSHGSAPPVAAAPPLGGIQPKPAGDTTAKPPTVTGSDPAPAGVAPTASATALIKAAILSKAGTGLQNIDTWCWYYANERGVPCPAPDEIPADQRGKLLSFDEWWGWAQGRGLSGYGLAGYYRS